MSYIKRILANMMAVILDYRKILNSNNHKVGVVKKQNYVDAHAPHLLKLLRNWFLNTDFVFEDGTKRISFLSIFSNY